MIKRNVKITLDKAIELFNSNDESLKEIVLQAFSKEELMHDFKKVTTFKKACEAINLNFDNISVITKDIARISKASAAMFKLNIIRKALNLGNELLLAKNSKDPNVYYPFNPLMNESSSYYKEQLISRKIEIIGKIKNKEDEYYVLSGGANYICGDGLGCFDRYSGVGGTNTNIGFIGCASREIAQHFGKYFGMLITEAKYADIVDFEVIEEKYKI